MGIASIISTLALSPLQDGVDGQRPLLVASDVTPDMNVGKGPSFSPPGGFADYPFECKYPNMTGWEACTNSTDRGCWLRRKSDGKKYDIYTDYENDMPKGIERPYSLELKDGYVDADGMNFTTAKLFNNLYPGTWIQACWGDT